LRKYQNYALYWATLCPSEVYLFTFIYLHGLLAVRTYSPVANQTIPHHCGLHGASWPLLTCSPFEHFLLVETKSKGN